MDTTILPMTSLEKKLLEKGFSNFSTLEKNDLVAEIALAKGLAYTDVTETYIFGHHKQIKTDLMSVACTNSIIKGYQSTNGHFYRTTLEDQVNMIAQKEYLNSHPEMTVVKWKTQDSGYIDHDVEEWVKLYYEGFSYKMATLYKSERIKRMIALAINDHELTSLDWDTFEIDFPEENPVVETDPVEEDQPVEDDIPVETGDTETETDPEVTEEPTEEETVVEEEAEEEIKEEPTPE